MLFGLISFVNVMKNRKINNRKIEGRLLKILKHSIYSVPFYHQEIKKIPIKTFNTTWRKICLLNRNVLEKKWKNFISLSYPQSLLKFRLTTGTTGNKIKIFFNPLCYSYMNGVYLRNLLDSGYKLSERIVHYDRYKPDEYFFQNFGIFERTWVPSAMSEREQLETLIKHKNSFLSYFTNSLFFISLLAKKSKVDIEFIKIFLQAEKLIEPIRFFLENFFQTKIIDFYGCVETGIIGYEIEKNVYKINNDLVFVEILDKNNDIVGEGERGKVVITNLLNKAFPLIRYEVGDFATVIEKKDGIITKISDINRYALEKALKKRGIKKAVEIAIEQNLEKFVLAYDGKKDKLELSSNEKFLGKRRGKYEFIKTI